MNWRPGDDVIIVPAVSNDEARTLFPAGWKELKPYLRVVAQPRAGVRYRKQAIAMFDAPIETVFRYMSAGGHPHAAFKSHRLVSFVDGVVTLDAEIYNPDGSTFLTTITHKLGRPTGIETTMKGGAFDGARFVHAYTPVNGRTKVDLAGELPVLPGMSEAEELKMIDGFFSMVFAEDETNIRTWQEGAR